MRNSKGQFAKGNSGFWLGKERKDLKQTNAAKTMFKVGSSPWNKGKPSSEKVRKILAKFSIKGVRNNTGKTLFKKGQKPSPHKILSGKDHPAWRKPCLRWKGENNPNWKGGTTKGREKARKTFKYKDWRIAVFERDNYTCQVCGQIGGKLEADHIKSWSLYPRLRYIIKNGRTLCHNCHTKTESYLKNISKKEVFLSG